MALDFSKFNFFSKLDARARVLVLIGAVMGVLLVIYLLTRFILGSSNTTGPSQVASAPSGVQSVPGSQLTPEYQRALEQANQQQAQQAQMQGGSAFPTAINYSGSQGAGGCIICSEQSANVKDYLDDWVKKGKLNPNLATDLQNLADKKVPVEEYAAMLDRLVKEGKLTPEQARQLLEQYKKQHDSALAQDSAKLMDNMIKNGQLPLDSANALLDAQKRKISPNNYADLLQGMVNQGKISPDVAQQLLAQYTQQRAKEIVMQSIALLRQMASRGELTPDILRQVIDFETRMIPIDTFAASLQKFVAAGKLTPAVANKIQQEYVAQKLQIGPSGAVNDLLQQAEAAAYKELSDLLSQNKITQETAQQILGLIQKNVSLADFQAALAQMVAQQKLTPDIAKLKLADYQQIANIRDLSQRLASLQGNNVAPGLYAEELKRAVQAGILTPEQAADLMRQYQALSAPLGTQAGGAIAGGTEQFAQLQQRVQQGTAATGAVASANQFVSAPSGAPAEVTQTTEVVVPDRQPIIDAIKNAMAGQAQQLVAAWQPPVMQNRTGSYGNRKSSTTVIEKHGRGEGGGRNETGGGGVPIIKAGSISFAVLDTEANSDYPDSPVMATIVEGPFKGAKLMGKLQTAKNAGGQLSRIGLNFQLMNMAQWPTSRGITAVAIDPDTARTVMASSVDNHYLVRYGARMGAAFVLGFANAVNTSSSTSTTGIFGTSTTHPAYSFKDKLTTAIGQVGQDMSTVLEAWTNIPPTVKVDSGVGLGILFMADVT